MLLLGLATQVLRRKNLPTEPHKFNRTLRIFLKYCFAISKFLSHYPLYLDAANFLETIQKLQTRRSRHAFAHKIVCHSEQRGHQTIHEDFHLRKRHVIAQIHLTGLFCVRDLGLKFMRLEHKVGTQNENFVRWACKKNHAWQGGGVMSSVIFLSINPVLTISKSVI